MNKKEKYINYIIEDMIKKTDIDYDREKIKFPFYSPISSSPFLPSLYLFIPSHFSSPFLFSSFSNYIKEKYGAHSEEIEIIWDQYKERIESLINNE